MGSHGLAGTGFRFGLVKVFLELDQGGGCTTTAQVPKALHGLLQNDVHYNFMSCGFHLNKKC